MVSWLLRDSLRTPRPKSTIGMSTSGTPASTYMVSLVLVISIKIKPPIKVNNDLSAIEAEEPITV